jgi:adenine-specific DNA methylase
MTDRSRLIEHAFPLKQASLDSVHEKNVRHGHISTLHIWPARRPLAACRAALIATLLPDPGTPEARQQLCEKIGGKVIKKIERKKMPNGEIIEREREETVGGILHWGREIENKECFDWFRQEIRKAYGGQAPRLLDPFAGGGAIPLEAMRLGCEATAVDINPVAWFILKCTLEDPQKLMGKLRPLPKFILDDPEFMDAFYKANGRPSTQDDRPLPRHEKQSSLPYQTALGVKKASPQADLAWHVRAWGRWVLEQARRDLAQFYPTYAEFEPLDKAMPKAYEKVPMKLVPLKADGSPDIEALNAEFGADYLEVKRNPRWVAKPPVAYLWARTVRCKNCRAKIPLLKTRWLCKTDKKRVLLAMEPDKDRTGVIFKIENNVAAKGVNSAQRREYDKRLGSGTMTKAGVTCPCCGLPSMMMEDLRMESMVGRSGYIMTAVVTEGPRGKEYRHPTDYEYSVTEGLVPQEIGAIKNLPNASILENFNPCSTRSISAQLYGVKKWIDLFLPRQALSIALFGRAVQKAAAAISQDGYGQAWRSAIVDYLCLGLDRLLCFLCVNARWKPDADSLTDAFSRFSISLLWDFAEAQPLGTSAGSYIRCNDRVASALDNLIRGFEGDAAPKAIKASATDFAVTEKFDAIITDPPYYQAVSYGDLADFSYSWLRGFMPELPDEFQERLSDKSKEAVQHIREDKDRIAEGIKYENQMAEAFSRAKENLKPEGRFICVFAHKDPDAWETLVSSIIKAGFVVTGSWPIKDNLPSRQRASSSAALASSVWLVCRPRPAEARMGWDNQVLEEMRKNIRERLREFWDAGIRGPDFVWAATGPALEAYSKHPVVKKANEPGVMTVGEFLTHVRRMVVDFVVGRVLSGNGFAIGGEEVEVAGRDRLDEPTAYYLLHRHDFGLDEAPSGACILYAISCGISDKELADTWDIIGFTKGKDTEEREEGEPAADAEEEEDTEERSGSKVKLKSWAQRKGKLLGYEAPGGKPVPLIDRVHRLMHLWKAGDLSKVDSYLDENGLRRHELFRRLLQSLIELATHGSEERSLLESISNHIQAKGAVAEEKNAFLPYGSDGDNETKS